VLADGETVIEVVQQRIALSFTGLGNPRELPTASQDALGTEVVNSIVTAGVRFSLSTIDVARVDFESRGEIVGQFTIADGWKTPSNVRERLARGSASNNNRRGVAEEFTATVIFQSYVTAAAASDAHSTIAVKLEEGRFPAITVTDANGNTLSAEITSASMLAPLVTTEIVDSDNKAAEVSNITKYAIMGGGGLLIILGIIGALCYSRPSKQQVQDMRARRASRRYSEEFVDPDGGKGKSPTEMADDAVPGFGTAMAVRPAWLDMDDDDDTVDAQMAAEAAQHIKGFGAVERRLSVLQSRDRRSSLLQTQAKLLDRIAKGETQKFKDDAGNLHPLQFLRIEGKPGAELPSFLPSSQNQMEPPRMSTHKKTQKTDQWKAFHGNDDENSGSKGAYGKRWDGPASNGRRNRNDGASSRDFHEDAAMPARRLSGTDPFEFGLGEVASMNPQAMQYAQRSPQKKVDPVFGRQSLAKRGRSMQTKLSVSEQPVWHGREDGNGGTRAARLSFSEADDILPNSPASKTHGRDERTLSAVRRNRRGSFETDEGGNNPRNFAMPSRPDSYQDEDPFHAMTDDVGGSTGSRRRNSYNAHSDL